MKKYQTERFTHYIKETSSIFTSRPVFTNLFSTPYSGNAGHFSKKPRQEDFRLPTTQKFIQPLNIAVRCTMVDIVLHPEIKN